MTMASGTLLVLMWKHSKVRIRRYIHTTLEIVTPIFLFALLFSFRSLFSQSNRHQEESYPEPVNSYLAEATASGIIFTPNSSLANSLISSVASELNLQQRKPIPNHTYTGYWGVQNETDLLKYGTDILQLSKSPTLFVIFKDLNELPWPKTLNYTLRQFSRFSTHSYKALDGTGGHHKYFGTIYEPFVFLQWAIDKTYLNMMTGTAITQELYLQEFPYPKSQKKNEVMENVYNILVIITLASPIMFFVFIVSRLLEERCSGVKELMKMVGVSPTTLRISHMLNSSIACLMFTVGGTLLLKCSSTPILPNTDAIILALTLFIYFIFIISVAFVCSAITESSQHAVSLALSVFFLLLIPAVYVAHSDITNQFPFFSLTGLLPHRPIFWFWKEVTSLETFGQGISWSNIAQQHSSTSKSVLHCWLYLLIHIALLSELAWYLDNVRPGKYGVAKPWNFIFKPQFWKWKKVKPDEDTETTPVAQESSQYFEPAPRNLEVGIKIANVSKVFGSWLGPKNRALTNVSLDIYKGEITVLLGHNGAGKTTLMSIITGMYSATEGKVFINGFDNSQEMSQIRKNLGLCPQHNLTFCDLTVEEHVIFFAMLKGSTYKSAKTCSDDLLTRLNIRDKANNKSAELSGGMKRRLQLACALAGGAEVLVLDEPTSGLDVETRRELWNLLLSLRGERTVLLTTHFMEEADALGDRVAVLHAGKLRCHATPMYLKRAIGTGYRLSLTMKQNYNEEALLQSIYRLIPEVSIKEKTLTSLSLNLPSKHTTLFPNLFNDLEENKSDLGIETLGVGVTTLEEVFLKLCSDEDTVGYDLTDNGHTVPTNSGLEFNKVYGLRLYLQQVLVLLRRLYIFSMSQKWKFLAFQIVLPIIVIYICTYYANNDHDVMDPPKVMSLDLYKDLGESTVYYNIGNLDSADVIEPAKKRYPLCKFVPTENVAEEILKVGLKDVLEYNKLLVGIELNATTATVLYTTIYRHTLPAALNLLSNMLAGSKLPWARESRTITTVNYPLEKENLFRDVAVEAKSSVACSSWALFIGLAVIYVLMPMVTIAIKERVSGSRHLHIMAGCPPIVHWGAMWLWHMTIYILVVPTTILIAVSLLDYDSTFTSLDFIGATCLLTVAYGAAFLSFIYLLSFFCGESSSAAVVMGIWFVVGLIAPLHTTINEMFDKPSFGTVMFDGFSKLFPVYNFALGLMKLTQVARLNAFCQLNKQSCPTIPNNDPRFPVDECCQSNSTLGPLDYFVSKNSALPELVLLLVQWVLYMSIVLLVEDGFMNRLWDKIKNNAYREPKHFYKDPVVRAERAYVDKKIALQAGRRTLGDDAILANHLHKNYQRLFKKSCNSVKGVSFSVKTGECFGLLGVNGAGKSTIFKMLTGVEAMTRGQIYANGFLLQKDRAKYLSTLTYCPQFGGIDKFLSGWDNLELLVKLRGVPPSAVKEEVTSWIDYVGLSSLASRAVGTYSGGCERRLATAAALASSPAGALLDEPTAGVDASARRLVWRSLQRSIAAGLSVVITSHSMDEMEALCGRIAIMSRGELCALGSAAELRAQHATGYAARLKLRTPTVDTVDAPMSVPGFALTETGYKANQEVELLKQDVQDSFNSTLKDEHKSMLHYHIDDTIRYSELFTKMENIKERFTNIVEDYTISETTLEEVFLSFAKDSESDSVRVVPV